MAPPPGGDGRLERISRQLDTIEAEMRSIGFWVENPPDLRAKYMNGELKSFLDAPSFELWLQQVFLPNARDAVAHANLPRNSDVGLMAFRQYDHLSYVPSAQRLLSLLSEFDDLIKGFWEGR